jgi:hypothetical protein
VFFKFVVGAALIGTVLASGCVGGTGFPTGVGDSSATLHGQGTTGGNGTNVFFQYWKTSTPATVQETPRRAIGPNVRGPFSERVTTLAQNTQYAYRLCGAEGGNPICAQTRTFITGRDNVQAAGATTDSQGVHFDRINFNASSDPAGGNPGGRAFVRALTGNTVIAESGSTTQDTVACVDVFPDPSSGGVMAIVGFTGGPFPVFAYLLDAGAPGSGRDRFGARPVQVNQGEQVTDCADAGTFDMQTLASGDVAISDN